jgi:hypothetical protein
MTAGILPVKLGYRRSEVGSDPGVGLHPTRRILAGALGALINMNKVDTW